MAEVGRVRVVRGTHGDTPARRWEDAAAELVDAAPAGGAGWDPVQVLGGPGTGKTSLLVDVAVSRLRSPSVGPESVLVLASGSRAARDVRAQVTAGLTGSTAGSRTVREPLVRTVHSYAFAVLRVQAMRNGNPPPRLVTGPEQDVVVRELLRGDVLDGARAWPESLRPALGLAGFAAELRDLLLRATERGQGPEDLVRLGRLHRRPEWVAAGRFGLQYEQSVLLRSAVGMEAPQASAPAVDAAGLISSALDALAGDPELLAAERARVRHLLVDDAQHLDAGAAQLVRLLGTGADETVVAGDPDQAVFGFRGAEPAFLTGMEGRRVLLGTTHRCAPAIADAVASVTARLAGRGTQRGPAPAPGAAPGSVTVQLLGTVAQEAAAVADTLRRAHLVDGVGWAEMAVVVRSTVRSLSPLRRALLAAGVPMTVPTAELPLGRQHAAVGFLIALRALTADPAEVAAFDSDSALALLSSPLGRADPVSLRRLQRGLRRVELAGGGVRDSAQMVRDLLLEGEAGSPGGAEPSLHGLTAAELEPLRRVRRVLAAGAVVLRARLGVEEVLWALWRSSGLERRWLDVADRGGTAGAQADRDLDVVVALFDAAARYVDRLPRATVAGFVDYLADQEIAGDVLADRAPAEAAVTVLTAHSAVGRQWRLVVVAGVQEGLWPSLRSQGSLLGVEQLVDVLSGGPGPELDGVLSRTAPLLAEERRLFLVACSRAAERLVVTAVQGAAGDAELVPSRFLDELVPSVGSREREPAVGTASRGLVLAELVADLRAAVCDPATSAERRTLAAAQLARLAASGVPGAHPTQWYGLSAPSTAAALWHPEDGPVAVSPSTVELLGACPLRWLLERHGGQDGSATAAVAGTLVHTLVQAIAGRTPTETVDAELVRTWSAVELGAPWFAQHELERTRAMLGSFRAWWERTRAELTEVAVEVAVDTELRGEVDGEPVTAQVRGRIDRLERDRLGRLVVVDVKTGRTPVSKEAATGHAQLATYQLAAAEGGVEGHPECGPSGGARLVYVAKNGRDGATERTQPAPDAELLLRWRQQVLDAAAATRGPSFVAAVNDGCQHCPVRAACPAQESGRQVTQP